ncbi:MAG: hypothetical protein WC824_12640 [Bacteroidota bacterium]|jgi:photosystem II stability/assembly factor-like uncharacterized protein
MRNYFFIAIAAAMLIASPSAAQDPWTRVDGPPGAELMDIVQSGDTIITTTMNRKFWRSEDGGNSWQNFPGIKRNFSSAVGRLYQAHGRIWLMDTSVDSLYLYQRASGWELVPAPFDFKYVRDVLVVGDSVILAQNAAGAGVLLSTDAAGLQWSNLTSGLPASTVSCVGLQRSNNGNILICCASGKGVYRRKQDSSWTVLSTAQEVRNLTEIVHTGRGFLAVTAAGTILQSTDGTDWSTLTFGGRVEVSCIAVDGADVYIATGDGFYLSADSGKSWRNETMQLNSLPVMSVDVRDERIAIATMPFGAFVSSDGGQNWRQSEFSDMSFGQVLEHKGDLVAGHRWCEAYFRRAASGWEWLDVPTDGWRFPQSHMLFSHGNRMYYTHEEVLTGQSRLFRTEDDGVFWLQYDDPVPAYDAMIASADRWVFVTSPQGIFRTQDNGVTWQERDAGLLLYPRFIGAAVGHLYVISDCEIRYSTDNGDTWNADTLGLQGQYIRTLIVTDSMVVVQCYGSTGMDVFVRRHGDAQFHPVPAGTPPNTISVEIVFAYGSVVFGSTSNGRIYRLNPDTGIWELWDEGFIGGRGSELRGIAGTDVYASDPAGGLWTRSLTGTMDADPISSARDLTLDSWPQPANDLLHLRLHGGEGRARIILTDLLGHERISFEGEGDAHILNVAGLPAGAYFLRVLRDGEWMGKMVIKRE